MLLMCNETKNIILFCMFGKFYLCFSFESMVRGWDSLDDINSCKYSENCGDGKQNQNVFFFNLF